MKCPECKGEKVVDVMVHHEDCVPFECHPQCPVQIQQPCDKCDGSGEVEE